MESGSVEFLDLIDFGEPIKLQPVGTSRYYLITSVIATQPAVYTLQYGSNFDKPINLYQASDSPDNIVPGLKYKIVTACYQSVSSLLSLSYVN